MRVSVLCSILLLLFALLPAEVVEAPIGSQIDAFMQSHEEDGFYGALVVARDGEVLLAKGYGWADRDGKIPATENTAFSTGSITKQFTAAAILKLEEQGKIKVSDPITRYFDGVPADKQAITLHHLLTHTAGFPGAIGDDYAEVLWEEFIRLAWGTPLASPPGDRYEYSNVGFSILAAIVEKISGLGYEEFLHQYLFQPAGMMQTGYRIPSFQRLAHGYREQADWGTMLDQKWADDGPYWHLRGNGGIVSTPMDMYRWYQALRDGKVLSAASLEKLFTPHVEEGEGAGTFYGYGWSIADTRWGKLITHNGGNGIFRAELQWFTEPDVFVYICSSRSDRSAFPLLGRIDRLVMEDSTVATDQIVSLPASPGGRLAQRFFELVQQGDLDAYLEFIETRFAHRRQEKLPAERQKRMFGMLKGDLQGSKLRAANESPGKIQTIVETADSRWLQLGFDFEGESEELRIAGVTIDGIPGHRALTLIEEMAAGRAVETPSSGRDSRDWGLPGSDTGRRGSQLLTAIYEATDELVEEFVSSAVSPAMLERTPAARLRRMLARLHHDLGDFKLVGAAKQGPNAARLQLQTPGGAASISFSLEAEAPHRFESLEVEIGGPDEGPSTAGPAGSSPEDRDRFLAEEAEQGRFSGVVLVGKGGEIEFLKAYGLANRRYQIPNQTDTRFNIGSINKLFTSVAVLQLVQQGRLELDAPIGRYLEGFPAEVAERVTVRHLLRHESGWGSYWENPDFIARRTELRRVSDYLEFIRKIPLGFEPGSRQEYSNTGFEVLGALVEAASGQDYYDYIRRHVYQPAGMNDSGSFEIDLTVPNVATGYTNQSPFGPTEGFVRENTQILSVKGTPAGGGYSTAEDMWRFAQALLGDRLLSREYTNFLLTGFEEMSSGEIAVGTGFGGGAPGVNAMLEIDTGSSNVTVVLSNYDPPAAGRIARAIR